MDLSVLIPSRNEQFLARTIENILENIEGDTEVIAILDGNWPDPPIADHPRVTLIHHTQSIGQRAATNEAARVSTAKYIMKCDAHCAFDRGFDVKLMADMQDDWTVIPRMYNLHAFDWRCAGCGNQTYQGPRPVKCEKCDNVTDFEMVIIWQPRLKRKTDFARFDNDLHFQYWSDYGKRPEAQGGIADVMCSVGACWFMHRARYWDLGGLDEGHGSWGQMGVEISAKSWLSGGRQVVNKKTWFAHMFRTQDGFGFPYPNPGIEQAREHSRHLWLGGNWSKAIHPLSWLIDKFAPVPDWESQPVTKGIVYYTDNRLDEHIMAAVQNQLIKSINGHQLISVSLKPLTFGVNKTLDLERGVLTMFRQILAGLEASTADIIFLAEHDVIYAPEYFSFTPPGRTRVYYNTNVWHVRATDGHAVYYTAKRTSQLCAYRDVLLAHYRKRVERVEKEGFSRKIGFEPGSHSRKERIDDLKSDAWVAKYPNLDIKHGGNLTAARWHTQDFRDQRNCRDWIEADEIPYWGVTKGRFEELLCQPLS